jgi:hypothetical protein
VGSLFGFFRNDSNWMISRGSFRSAGIPEPSSANVEPSP